MTAPKADRPTPKKTPTPFPIRLINMITSAKDAAETIATALPIAIRYEGLGDGDPKKPLLQFYWCPAGWATIGYGIKLKNPETGFGLHKSRPADVRIAPTIFPEGITEEQALAALISDLALRYQSLAAHASFLELEPNQRAAVLDLSMNIGLTALFSSTAWEYILAGHFETTSDDPALLFHLAERKSPITELDEAFTAWCRYTDDMGRKRVSHGLFARRYSEYLVFTGVSPSEAIERADEAVREIEGAGV